MEIVNLSETGLPREECQKAATWMAQAFAGAPATPALTIFFGAAPYESNAEMHESFWSSHLNRVAKSGLLIGARENGEWLGFRAFFEPGKSRLPYVTDFRLDDNEDWDRFLELAGETKYTDRVRQWGEVTSHTTKEVGLIPGDYYTTSIIVVNEWMLVWFRWNGSAYHTLFATNGDVPKTQGYGPALDVMHSNRLTYIPKYFVPVRAKFLRVGDTHRPASVLLVIESIVPISKP